MARIPIYTQQTRTPGPAALPTAGGVRVDDSIGVALQRAGAAIGAGGRALTEGLMRHQEAAENSWISDASAQLDLEWTRKEIELRQGAGPGAPDYAATAEREFDALMSNTLKQAPSDRARAILGERLAQMRANALSKALSFEATERNRLMVNEYQSSVETNAAIVAQNPAKLDEVLSRANGDYVAAAETWMTPEQAVAARDEARDKIVTAAVGAYRDMAQRASLAGDASAARDYLSRAEAIVSRFYGARPELPAPGGEGQRQLEGHAVSRLTAGLGISPQAAAAIVGHLIQESGLDTKAVGDGGAAEGLAQWRDARLDELKRFAEGRGKDYQDFDTQIDFLIHEMRGGDAGARRALEELRSARTLEDAVAAFMHFERPSGYTPDNPRAGHGWENRLANARRIAGVSGPDAVAPSQTAASRLYAALDAASLDIDRNVKAFEKEVEARTEAEHDAWFNDFRIQLARGEKGLSDIIAAQESGRLSDFEDIKAAYKALDGFDTEITRQMMALEAYRSGQPFNSADPDSVKMANAAYEAMGGGAALADGDEATILRTQEFIARSGIVPESAVQTVIGMTRAPSPDTMMQGFQLLDSFYRQNPDATARALSSSELDRLQDWQALQQFYTTQELHERFRKQADPAAAAARAKLRDQGEKLAADVSDDTLVDLFDPGLFSWGPDAPVYPETMARLRADFDRLFADRYAATGNADIAKQQAAERLRTVWGGSDANRGRIMRYPPEKYLPPIDGSHEWIRDQLRADLATLVPEFGDYALIATPATQARPGTGYLVAVDRGDGVLDLVRDEDGAPLSWSPDFNAAREERRRRFEQDRGERLPDDPEQRTIALERRAAAARARGDMAEYRRLADEIIETRRRAAGGN